MYVEGGTRKVVGKETKKYEVWESEILRKHMKKKDDRIVKKGFYTVDKIEYPETTIRLNLYKEAYDWMSNPDEVPSFFMEHEPLSKRQRTWKHLEIENRIDIHMAFIARCNFAKSYKFTILED